MLDLVKYHTHLLIVLKKFCHHLNLIYSFSEGQKLDFGNPFSNVNKAFAHVLINKDNLSCKTCFNRNIPGDFLNDMFLLLSKFKLIKSLNN